MPRFHFDVQDGLMFVLDEEGQELDSLEAAKHEAAKIALEISRERLAKGDVVGVKIEVRDGHRQHVLTVNVEMEIN